MRTAFISLFSISLLSTMLGVGAAFAGDDGACAVAQNLVHADYALPQVASAIQQQHLDIAAGTGEPGLTVARLAPRGHVVLTDLSAPMPYCAGTS